MYRDLRVMIGFSVREIFKPSSLTVYCTISGGKEYSVFPRKIDLTCVIC